MYKRVNDGCRNAGQLVTVHEEDALGVWQGDFVGVVKDEQRRPPAARI
ncbi:MAG: hypothetical protein ACUVRU_02445 [Anaerolineae bacterium]